MKWLDKTRELLGESIEESQEILNEETAYEKRLKAGLDYEKDVRKAMQSAQRKHKKQLQHLVLKRDSGRSAYDAHSNDLELVYTKEDGKKMPLFIELKANIKATFGSMSFEHFIGTDDFKPLKKYTEDFEETLDTIVEFLMTKSNVIKRRFNVMKKVSKEDHKKIFDKNQFTITVPRYAYEGMLASKSGDKNETSFVGTKKIQGDAIAEHYNQKDVYYIQVGGKGLFYIGKDILNLGVPKFNPKLEMMVRIRPSGDKKHSDGHVRKTLTLTGEIRVQSFTKSTHSLEDADDYLELFGRDVE